MIKKIISYILTSLLIINNLIAQNILFPGTPKIFNYSKETYNAGMQNWNFTQDERGFLYIANTAGLLIYDGVNWQLIKLPQASLVRDVKIASDGRIYVCGYNNLGYLSADSVGNFKYVDILSKHFDNKLFGNFWALVPFKNYIVTYTDSLILLYNTKQDKFQKIKYRGIFYSLRVINDSLYVIAPGHIFHLNIDSQKIFFKPSNVNKKININGHIAEELLEISPNQIFTKYADTLIITDSNFNIIKKKVIPGLYNSIHSITTYKNQIFINPSNKGIFILDTNLNVIYHITKASGLNSNSFYALFIDKSGNLWTGSDMGLNYIILNTPFSYLDKSVENIRNVYNLYFSNYFILGLSNLVKYISKDELFDPYISFKKAKTLPGFIGQTWDYLILDTNLYLASNPGFIKISQDLNYQPDYLNGQNTWAIERLDSSKVLIAQMNGLLIADIKDNQLTNFKKIKNIRANIENVVIDKDSTIWLSGYSDSLFVLKGKIDFQNLTFKIKKIYGKRDGLKYNNGIVTLNFDKFHNIILADDDYLIKKYDPKQDKFVSCSAINSKLKTPDSRLYTIGIDDLGNYWINYVNYNSPPGLKYMIYLFKYKDGKLIFNKYLTNSLVYRDYALGVYTYKKRYVFLSTTKGPVIFDYLKKLDINKLRPKVYLRKIVCSQNDSIIWAGNTLKGKQLSSKPPKNIKIPYKYNGLTFYIAAPFFENTELLQFSYYLKGFDKKWSAWTTDSKKEYSFLKEGNYTLLVKVKNLYGLEAQTYAYSFKILPPWYRSTLAYIFYAILIATIIYLSSVLYAYNLKKKNEKLEQIIRERTREIEMKNAELEQQKEEIQTQAEELAEINKELEKLSIIVQKTDNAVLLTDEKGNFIWVNPAFTKIFGFTLEELIGLISPNIIGANTKPEIKAQIQKCINDKVTVEYEGNFITKNGNKIWVHTTLTPIIDENNQVTGLIAIDSDITKLKEAEEKIRIQNENIKGSIHYAQIIQKSILPLEKEIKEFFDTFIIYLPRDIVSGDFYWMSNKFTDTFNVSLCSTKSKKFKVGDYIFFAVVDCTGHGVPGAFMSLIGNRALENIVNQKHIHKPAQILQAMDDSLAHTFKHIEENYRDGMVVSLCRFDKICVEGKNKIKVTFAGAKLDIIHYEVKTKKFIEHKGVRRSIGQTLARNVEFKSETFYLEEDDVIFMYSDGYKDQNNVKRVRIGINKFKQLLHENADKPMKEIKQALLDYLNNWMKGTEQRDDITVIGLKMKDL